MSCLLSLLPLGLMGVLIDVLKEVSDVAFHNLVLVTTNVSYCGFCTGELIVKFDFVSTTINSPVDYNDLFH